MRRSLSVRPLLLCMLCITLLCVGCGEDKQKVKSVEKEGTKNNSNSSTDKTPKIIQPVGDGADAAVQRVINGLQANNPSVVWEALPTSYQQDMNDLIHQYANQMDEEIWTESFTTMKKAARIVRKQKQYSMAQAIARNGPKEVEHFEKSFDEILLFIDIILESDIADIKKLRTMDVGEIIQSVGGKSMQQFDVLSEMAVTVSMNRLPEVKMSQMKVKLLSSEGGNATVLISSPDKKTGKPKEQEVQFVKVEGKWIPQELATNWKNDIATAKQKMNRMTPDVVARVKPQLMNLLKRLNGGLDEMNDAQDAQAFSLATSKLYAIIFGFAMNPPNFQPEAKPVEPKPTGKGVAVTIIIEGKLTKQEVEKIEEGLLLMDSDDEWIVSTKQNDKNSIALQISPVHNLSVLAKSLSFGKVTKVDKDQHKIYVTIPVK